MVSRSRGQQQSSALTAKRYLILIYTVEFDRCVVRLLSLILCPQMSILTVPEALIAYLLCGCRIHYPLPLPYVGKPDPAALQKEVRALRAELCAVTSHGGNKSADVEIQRLRAEYVIFHLHHS